MSIQAGPVRLSLDNDKGGAFVAADQLQPTATATTVQVRNGERLTTDGPFAETKDRLGGYYLIDVESLDDALDWAAKIPSAKRNWRPCLRTKRPL